MEDDIANQADAWKPARLVIPSANLTGSGYMSDYDRQEKFGVSSSQIVVETDRAIYRMMGKNTNKQGS